MAMFGKRQSETAQPAPVQPAPALQYDMSQFAATPQSTNQIARAVLTPAVSTMISDGDINDWELAQLSNVCSFSPVFFEVDGDTMQGMVRAIIDEIRLQGHPETIKRAASSLSPKLRETALCFALRIALADGRIDEGEKNSISQTGYFMDIEPAVFDQILAVVAMMQRPPTA